MNAMEHPLMQRFVDAYRRLAAVGDPPWSMSVRRVNALSDALQRTIDDVRADRELFGVLRAYGDDLAVGGTWGGMPDRVAMDMLHQIVRGAVVEHRSVLERLRADVRVGVGADALQMANALYLAESIGKADPYEAEQRGTDEDEWHRDLSRIGGVPTQAGGAEPAGEFLLQIDLLAVRRQADHAEGLAELLREVDLPADGLLQVWHSTTGDSATDPGVPGGGGTLRHVAEADVVARRPLRPDPDAYPVSFVSMSVLPTFRSGPAAGDAEFVAVQALQDEAHRAASWLSEAFLEQNARNPFAARTDAVSYLFGLQAPDFEIDADLHVLARDLPLRDEQDRHVLFLTVAADRTFDTVFGDCGRLEYWLRASDLARARFADVVTFIRST